MIKAVLLDIDNTLLSFDEYVKTSMRTGFQKFGLAAYEPWMYDVFTRVNNGLWRQIEEGQIVFSQLEQVRWNRVFEQLGISFDGPVFEAYFRSCLRDSAIAVEGALELLRALSGRCAVAVASNGPYEQQVHRLDIGGMLPYIDHIFISEEIGAVKPSGAFFDVCMARLCEKMPVDRREVLMVGDSLTSDIGGGTAAGLLTCWYDPEGRSLPPNLHPDWVARSLGEIPAICFGEEK